MNKKTYAAVKQVRDFIEQQNDTVKMEYANLVNRIEKDGFLIEPFGKKLKRDLFEIRIRKGGNVRVFYFYAENDYVIGVYAFVKKSQNTPIQEIKKAEKTISLIKRGDYNE